MNEKIANTEHRLAGVPGTPRLPTREDQSLGTVAKNDARRHTQKEAPLQVIQSDLGDLNDHEASQPIDGRGRGCAPGPPPKAVDFSGVNPRYSAESQSEEHMI